MADRTIIAWTDHTANFWMGCQKISPGCTHCYAEPLTENRMGLHLWGPNSPRQPVHGVWANARKWHREAQRNGSPHRVFCMSLGDFFEDHPMAAEIRPRAWALIRETPMLHWQILTKRADRIEACLPSGWGGGWENVWLGVSIENAEYAARADHLRKIPAVVRFVSYEPALGPLAHALNLAGLDWLITGGESGHGFRPMNLQWARDMRDACRAKRVAFFFKQSSHRFTERGIQLDGEIVREYPIPRVPTEVIPA